MNINKIAASDAEKWARAQMFFGEGAGTRRKLLSAEIAHKVENINGYHEMFEKAYAKQDMAKHAVKAASERKNLDRAKFINRNVKGLITGNKQNLTTGVAAIATVAYFAHQTGLDKEAERYVKAEYKKAKNKVIIYRAKRKLAKQF